MYIEILTSREDFNKIIDLYELNKNIDLDIGYSDQALSPFSIVGAEYVLNVLRVAGLRKGVDYLIHGSLTDFDDQDHDHY